MCRAEGFVRSLIFIGTGEFTPQTKKGRVVLVPGSGQRGFPWSCSVPWSEAGPSPWQGMQGEALAVLPCRAALPFGRLEPQGSVKEGMVPPVGSPKEPGRIRGSALAAAPLARMDP